MTLARAHRRSLLPTVALAIAVFAVLAACGSNTVTAGESDQITPRPADGGTSTAGADASASGGPADGQASGTPDGSSNDGSNGSTSGSNGSTSGSNGSNSSSGPRIGYFKFVQRPKCSAAGQSTYAKIAWQTSGTTGVALSVDNPGLVGSYGSYGPSGSLQFDYACPLPGQTVSHVFTIYTVSSSGSRKSATLTASMTTPKVEMGQSSAPASAPPAE